MVEIDYFTVIALALSLNGVLKVFKYTFKKLKRQVQRDVYLRK